jgi:predicted DNA binding CopG/RHH family protein
MPSKNRVMISVPIELREEIRAKAEAKGLTIIDYIREQILK